jgi:hypothetical protein
MNTSPILCNGGTSILNFSITNAQGNPATSLANNSILSAGTYTLSIIDTANCVSANSFTITEPAPLMTLMNWLPIMCHGDSTQVTYTTIGGTPPYAQSIPTLTPWPAGSYTVFTNDANNCYTTDSIIIPQPSILVLTHSLTQTDTGVLLNATIQGGQPAYQSVLYIKNGNTYDSITSNIPFNITTSGLYKLVIMDQLGCSKEVEFIVNNIANIFSLPEKISMYPNPARDIVFVNNPINDELNIYDCMGKCVMTSNSSSIDIQNLPNGIYTLKLNNHIGRLVIER